MAMAAYKNETLLMIPALEDSDCRRFCFESCRLYDDELRSMCISAHRECDCLQKKTYVQNQLHPFLSSDPSIENCNKYCRKGSCQKYFKLDSSAFSECVGAILLCNCHDILRAESLIGIGPMSMIIDDESQSQLSTENGFPKWLIISLLLVTVLSAVGVMFMICKAWRRYNRRVMNAEEGAIQNDGDVNTPEVIDAQNFISQPEQPPIVSNNNDIAALDFNDHFKFGNGRNPC